MSDRFPLNQRGKIKKSLFLSKWKQSVRKPANAIRRASILEVLLLGGRTNQNRKVPQRMSTKHVSLMGLYFGDYTMIP